MFFRWSIDIRIILDSCQNIKNCDILLWNVEAKKLKMFLNTKWSNLGIVKQKNNKKKWKTFKYRNWYREWCQGKIIGNGAFEVGVIGDWLHQNT